MKAIARFAIMLVALFVLTGWLLTFWFTNESDRHAVIVSASLAAAVQLATYGIVLLAGPRNALAAWGMGIIIRGTVLVLYGLVLAKLLGLPLAASLVSFAVFLFVSMLLESFLISNAS
ncbi:MAG TPA: hypothetical protein VHM24_05815 [Gemmatimonadaceae bacterium]|nr:hypothetical protein [Gemmatimonadaceae bacterium]